MRWVSDDVNTLLRFTAVHLEKKGAYAGLNLPYHSISIFRPSIENADPPIEASQTEKIRSTPVCCVSLDATVI